MKKIHIQIDKIKLLEDRAIIYSTVILNMQNVNEKAFELDIKGDRLLKINEKRLEKFVADRAIDLLKKKYGIVDYIKDEVCYDVDINKFIGVRNLNKVETIYQLENNCIKVQYTNGEIELYIKMNGCYGFRHVK